MSKLASQTFMMGLAYYLFVPSNNTSKQPDDMSNIGPLATQCFCDMAQITPPSQICTIETTLFRLVQVVGASIYHLRCISSLLSLYFYLLCTGVSHIEQRDISQIHQEAMAMLKQIKLLIKSTFHFCHNNANDRNAKIYYYHKRL